MRYVSLCDGIGAAHVAWQPLGWSCVGASEISRFPAAVVRHHHPTIAELGDMTKHNEWNIEGPDLICGGTPCQPFSTAGLRAGLADPRGNLALVFLGAVDRFRPRWVAWENVPGVLSSGAGRDFGSFLGALGQLGYGFAYRVLDARYFGVPQFRRRVFVVAHLGDWRPPAAVLFERHSLQGIAAPDPQAWTQISATDTDRGLAAPGWAIVFKVRGGGQGDGSRGGDADATGGRGYLGRVNCSFTCSTREDQHLFTPLVVRTANSSSNGLGVSADSAYAIDTADGQAVYDEVCVRRFTPVEYERLQGFPDDYTRIPWKGAPAELCPTQPRIKAVGNSWPVPLVRWIGERINTVDNLLNKLAA